MKIKGEQGTQQSKNRAVSSTLISDPVINDILSPTTFLKPYVPTSVYRGET